MSDKGPTVAELCEELYELVNWDLVAIHLPGITKVEIQMIQKQGVAAPNIQSQKLDLFAMWHRRCTNCTWAHVEKALRNEYPVLARKIADKYQDSMDKKPTVAQLQEELGEVMNWQGMALKLPGLTNADVAMVERMASEQQKKQKMFGVWKQRCAHCTWADVENALRRGGEIDLAKKIAEKYLSQQQQHQPQQQQQGLEEVNGTQTERPVALVRPVVNPTNNTDDEKVEQQDHYKQ